MYNPSTRENFLKHLSDGMGVVSYACEKTGISRKTFYRWQEKYNNFDTQVKEIQSEQVSLVEDKLLQAIERDNLGAIMFYLRNKHPDYNPRLEVKGEVEVNPYKHLTKDQLLARINDYLKDLKN